MDFEQEQQFIADIKRYVTENLPLSKMEDDELEERIEEIVAEKLYCPIPSINLSSGMKSVAIVVVDVEKME